MPNATYASATDLQQFFLATGLVKDPNAPPFNFMGWKSKLARAQEMLEERTGRVFGPTRASGVPVSATRTYDPPQHPRGILMLGADLVGSPVVSLSGTPQTLNKDFYLGPENADSNGLPWQWIEFGAYIPYPFGNVPLQRKSITVQGNFTYSLLVPDDIWDAHLACAAALMAPQIELTITNGIVAIEENSLKVTYSGSSQPSPLFNQMKAWLAAFDETCTNKRRVTVGLG